MGRLLFCWIKINHKICRYVYVLQRSNDYVVKLSNCVDNLKLSFKLPSLFQEIRGYFVVSVVKQQIVWLILFSRGYFVFLVDKSESPWLNYSQPAARKIS